MIRKKICPKCDSEEVDMVPASSGEIWICRDCGYSSANFQEKKEDSDDMDDDEDFIDELEIPQKKSKPTGKKKKKGSKKK